MSIQGEAVEALAVVRRARSLFGNPEPVGAAGAPLESAAVSAADAGMQADGLAGRAVERHRALTEAQSRHVHAASGTDTALETHLRPAADITEAGARRLDTVVAQTNSLAVASATASTPAAQLMVLTALRAQVATAQTVTTATRQRATDIAGQILGLTYGSGELPQAPPEAPDGEPPHGKDPRYWLDVTKIVHVPDGELAPANTVQIGPNLWYPAPEDPGFAVPAPPPAKYPLDLPDVHVIDPNSEALFPPGYQEVAPGIGVPYPDSRVPAPWPAPQQPIDIRDIIEVPPGQLAPSGYVEYLPGWWVPDRSSPLGGN
ncbi:DUF4226 domain-containing protein [Mycolicibacterium sp. BiH015]|uniref:DUF4226 domain-containing protein n=1 Tax=Mycolicibacterium sp. BiH015 TaxID=3018808 RepID=UPI0022E86458|nr:DUF4226 domain-containing protein [Mycolicibacterium sp. BiH015]MDA2893345.1 DUF4226 domain-containing protein [Mycolicibacterium sp. BiH015]